MLVVAWAEYPIWSCLQVSMGAFTSISCHILTQTATKTRLHT